MTLGPAADRLLRRWAAQSMAKAAVGQAVCAAWLDQLCADYCQSLLAQAGEGAYLTPPFSPGYGDMPIAQTREICEVLSAQRAIGLTVSAGGVMIPRKSVTAVMGVSAVPVARRPSGCEGCAARETCALRRR